MKGRVILAGVLVVAGAYTYHRISRHVEKHREIEVPVLMYHRIGERGDDVWWLPVEAFAGQMAFLKEAGYRTVLPSDLVARHRRGVPLPPKPIVITFDDGHLNCLTEAEPILRAHGFRAVNFLVTDLVAERADERRTYEDAPCLVWPEVRAMQERGTVAFGGHSRSHANLRALGRRAAREIQGCWEDLVAHGVERPEGFCIPYGEYRDETLQAIRESPFTIAFSVEDRIARIGGTNSLLAVPRVSVFGGARDFAVRSAAWRADGAAIDVNLAFRGRKQGLPATPRLVWPGQRSDEGWVTMDRIRPDGTQLVWRLAGDLRSRGPLALEIWDALRVLRHYREPLSPGDAGARNAGSGTRPSG
jgi:peptidoglycan/xylan/chitin deacetylase (PgdA/CDA1 family)